jgi:SAM-dependent methyltransferase
MQLGAIFSKYKHAREIINRIGFASFDVLNPPLQNGQFDGVAMFAALHHFPEPAVVLSRLANLVKPGGFIAVLCEPCGPLTDSEAYLRDLNAGINEQVFSVAEYRKIFTASGLEELSIRNDNGSLKAILHV